MTQRDDGLTERQRRMLAAGTFHVDGWCDAEVLEDAADLERRGYVTSFTGGDDQYTARNFTVTDKGRAMLAARKENN